MKKNKSDEIALYFGDALDSRAVVGTGKPTLIPGHVCEWGHHGGLWKCYGGTCPSTGPTKTKVQGVSGGS